MSCSGSCGSAVDGDDGSFHVVNTIDRGTVKHDDESSVAGSLEAGAAAGQEEPPCSERKTLAKSEQKAVTCMRLVVAMVLLVSMIVVAIGVYNYTRNDQVDEFEAQFETNANKLIETFLASVENSIVALGSLSASITLYAKRTGSRFPNVTLDDFEILGADTTRILSGGGLTVGWAPLVTEEDRFGWEEYALTERFWVNEATNNEALFRDSQDIDLGYGYTNYTAVRESAAGGGDGGNNGSGGGDGGNNGNGGGGNGEGNGDGNDGGNNGGGSNGGGDNGGGGDKDHKYDVSNWTESEALDDGTGYHPGIHVYKKRKNLLHPNGTGPYAPLWQASPVSPDLQQFLNLNFLGPEDSAVAFKKAIESRKATLGKIHTPNPLHKPQVRDSLLLGHYRHKASEYREEPSTDCIVPVVETFEADAPVVGIVYTDLYWRVLLDGILPSTARGYYVVLENSFGQTATYRIDNSKATYLDKGDLHDTKFDYLGISAEVNTFLQTTATADTRSYTTFPLDDNGRYQMRIYPSQETKDDFVTRKSWVYAFGACGIFLFTSLVFVVYDCMVERRQRTVMNRAVTSSAIVSSIFPQDVRNRLYEDELAKEERQKDANGWKAKKTVESPVSVEEDDSALADSNQIAKLYPESTIFFADLAGFTSWSSKRTPTEVFMLLETLYGAFDKIAEKRGVFKVETIGDCYVAITGVPEPQKNHASIMCRFARDCLEKMNELTSELADTLGPETAELGFRVGLHSGPVTAGVLRGKKARFQLFGDTVNTASRMESNGVRGRIHVSQQTADFLIAGGKESWVTPREDKIFAKGKGELQTYFVELRGSKAVSTSFSTTTASSWSHDTYEETAEACSP